MSQPVLDRALAVAPSLSAAVPPAPAIHLHSSGLPGVEHRPESETGLVLAAARADVIRFGFSAAVPSVGALTRVVALLAEELAAVGRSRSQVRLLLDLDLVLAADRVAARRRRAELEYLDALAGLSWSPVDGRVVTTADRLVDEVRELAERVGVDAVVLHPLGGGRATDDRLRALLR